MPIMTVEDARNMLPELERICSIRANPQAAATLAAAYFTLNEVERAEKICEGVWDRWRDPGVATNYAMILKELGQHEKSFHVIETAYWLNPQDEYTRLAYAEALLRAGFWKQAWPIYDNCRPTQQGAAVDVGVGPHIKEWNGSPLPAGHRLLVINEGGTGDRLNYARWLPRLSQMGVNWYFYPYEALRSLYLRMLPPDRVLKEGDEIDPTHWCTAFSLPAKLDVGPTEIPEPLPFLPTSETYKKYNMHRPDEKPVVGLCWRAAELHQGGRTVRSMSEGQAMRIVCQTLDKVHWVNLQHQTKMPAPVVNVPFDTWEDTVGLIANLDAVVTVDTGVFWLASSMKKPTYLILSGNSDWKFLTRVPKCYWSSSVTLFRNEGYGFEGAINQLVKHIRTHL